MLAVRLLTLAFLASVAGPGQLPGQPDTDLILRAVRSYRAEGGRTEVNAFVQVPYLLMQPTTGGPEGRLSYRVEVRVTDSTCLKLLEQSWQNQATAALRRPDAFAVDMVRFSLAPGRYRLEVAVVDSVSGHRAATGVDLEGFASAPAASDLLLSPQIRPTAAGDTVPRPAELRWGQMLVAAAARLDLTPLRPTAYYLLEAYSPAQANGTLRLRVADSTGKALITTAETPVQVPTGGGVLKGQLDLTGLPPGNYAGYFEAMGQEELELAKEPLVIVAESGELSKWSKDLSLRAKRRFLVDFWKRRDQTPDTPVNEARRVFYDGVAYAEKHFGEKGRVSAPGWRTDRGRIYIKYGEPEEQLDRVQAGRAVPYQVWRYRQGRDRYFVFADRSNGIGVYQLVHSNDVKEIGIPNWREIVTQEGVADIGRFLGVDFFDGSAGR